MVNNEDFQGIVALAFVWDRAFVGCRYACHDRRVLCSGGCGLPTSRRQSPVPHGCIKMVAGRLESSSRLGDENPSHATVAYALCRPFPWLAGHAHLPTKLLISHRNIHMNS